MPEGRTIVKKVENAILYSDDTILVQNVRLSYLHATRPYKGEDGDGEGRYGVVGLMPKGTHRAAKDLIREHINKIMAEQKVKLPPANKFLRDGDERPDKPEYPGNYTLNAGEKNPPMLRGRGKDPATGKAKRLTIEEADRVLYSGAWGNILIKPWYQNNKWGKKVNANLLAVQLAPTPPGMSDEAFGQGRISDDAVDESFTPIDDDDDGYDDEDDEL